MAPRCWGREGTPLLLFTVCVLYFTSVQAERPQFLPGFNLNGNNHGVMNSTKVYGIKTYLNQTISYKMMITDVTDYVCGSQSTCNRGKNDRIIKGLCTFNCSECPCKCDDRCHFYGDCCARKLFENSSALPSTRPEFVTCTGSKKFTLPKPYIYMVTKCPQKSAVDKSSRSKCNSPDLTILSEATPVSDMATEITYANKFCADCHGVEDYQSWSWRVKCPLETTLQKAQTRDELWGLVLADKDCFIQVQPPVHLEVRGCCPYTYSSCNVTGEWVENVSPVTEILCGLYEHTIDYYETSYSPVAYKNVFCAICNGVSLQRIKNCSRPIYEFKVIQVPSFSIVLGFNPPEKTKKNEERSPLICSVGQLYDPFSGICLNLSCPARRILFDGQCSSPYISCGGLEFSYEQEFRLDSANVVQGLTFLDEFLVYFEGFFVDLGWIHLFNLESMFKVKKTSHSIRFAGRFILISNSTRCKVDQLEERIEQFLSTPWTFNSNNNILFSRQIDCTNDEKVDEEVSVNPLSIGVQTSCFLVDLHCPFVVYDLTLAKFAYDSNTSTLLFEDQEIYLNTSSVSFCNGTLQVCSDVILEIKDVLDFSNTSVSQRLTVHDPTLSIVSTICISLSLVGLFATFVIFCLVSKLRTAPGKNTMALMFHLFWAQLLFLTLSNRVHIKALCQASAILIHYAWLTTFTWMMGLAYQIHKVFTSFPSMASNDGKNGRQVWVYLLICDLTATIPVIACVAYYQITSGATDLGYGKTICFLSESWAIGVFFTGPLCFMLAFNGFCFMRTLLTIGCKQKIKNTTANSNINFMFIYIKLSVLFGFSWTFGLLAAVFDSIVLWYIFVLLTGSQGIFLFITYCANKKIWTSFKTSLSEKSSTLSSGLSRASS